MATLRKPAQKKRSRDEIHAMRGSIKFDTGGKPFAEWWAEHKREEIELEQRKLLRFTASGKR